MNRPIAVALVVVIGTAHVGGSGPVGASYRQTESSRVASVAEMPATLPPLTPLEAAVKDAYAREYGEMIFRPAIFKHPPAGGCAGGHLITTAYLKSPSSVRLIYLYMTPDGSAVTRRAQVRSVVAPAGRFRVLTVIVGHRDTIGTGGLRLWEHAQQKINQDHASFASSRGLARPIVSFDNTNVLVAPNAIAEPRRLSSVREAVERNGRTTRGYQFIASINLDPARSEGGFSHIGDRFVYMGNYSKWARPLTAAQWINVANAVYHHEVAHHWGWAASHDWVPHCRGQATYEPSIVPPILFGWEDVDGDGVPEILDATPYGRSH